MNMLLQLLEWLKLPCISLCISLLVFDIVRSIDRMAAPSYIRMKLCLLSGLLWLVCTIVCWIFIE